METSYIDLEEKEKKKKEKLNMTHIPDVLQDELDDQGQDPTLASQKQRFPIIPQPTIPVTAPQPVISNAGGNASVSEGGSYESYMDILNEGLSEPVSTKEQQERLSRSAKITATGEMLNNVIDLIAGGGSDGSPIFRRADTATPAMLNQLERLRADDTRREEIHNAQKLQNQIRAISFGQQDKAGERISRHFYEGQHFRKEEREAGEKFRAGEGDLNREAAKEARKETRQFSKDEWEAKYSQALKNNIALDDHRTKNTLDEMKARYGYDAAIVAMKAAAGVGGSGAGSDTFFVKDDESGETIPIPSAEYWNIIQKIITKQNEVSGEDWTMNDHFKLSDNQLNALVAKEWKNYYTPPKTQSQTEVDTKANEGFATDLGALRDRIMSDASLGSIESKRKRFGIYIDQMAKDRGLVISPKQREQMLQIIQ